MVPIGTSTQFQLGQFDSANSTDRESTPSNFKRHNCCSTKLFDSSSLGKCVPHTHARAHQTLASIIILTSMAFARHLRIPWCITFHGSYELSITNQYQVPKFAPTHLHSTDLKTLSPQPLLHATPQFACASPPSFEVITPPIREHLVPPRTRTPAR